MTDKEILIEALEKCQMNIGDDVYEHSTKCDVVSREALSKVAINKGSATMRCGHCGESIYECTGK